MYCIKEKSTPLKIKTPNQKTNKFATLGTSIALEKYVMLDKFEWLIYVLSKHKILTLNDIERKWFYNKYYKTLLETSKSF